MAISNVWEEGDVPCKCKLSGVKYEKTSKVEFEFIRKDNKDSLGKVEAKIVSHGLLAKTAEATWKAKATGDDELYYVANFRLVVDGKTHDNFPDEVCVWAKQLEVTVKGKNGGKLPGALVTMVQTAPAEMQKKLQSARQSIQSTITRAADADGKVKIDLTFPADVSLAFKLPYALDEWVKNKGKKREAKARKTFTAKIVWPVEDATEHVHRQWVNLPADLNKLEQGQTLKVVVEPTVSTQGEDTDKVYLKAEYDGANNDRTPDGAEKGKGSELKLDCELGPSKTAAFDVPLGPAGGDKVKISVGSSPECADATVQVVTWRKIYYELMAPACIADTLPATTHPDGTAGFDLPAETTDFVNNTVLDKVFIKYECKASHKHGDAEYPAHQLYDSEYILRDAGAKVMVQSVNDYNTAVPAAFPPPDDITILMKLCSRATGSDTQSVTLEVTVHALSTPINVTNLKQVYVYPKLPTDGSGALHVSGCRWEAVTTGLTPGTAEAHGADWDHPGFDNGVKRTGAVKHAMILWSNHMTHVFVELDAGAEPGSFVGPKSATKCPVKLRFKLTVPKGHINGCALGCRQLMCIVPTAPKSLGATLAHELGHSMGMTIMPNGNKEPPGLPKAKHVDNGGDYYRNNATGETAGSKGIRACHQGPHCAKDVPDKSKLSYSGAGGTCIMFGEGGTDDAKVRAGYCDTCIKYLKARKLTSIKTSFVTRADKEC